MLNSIKKTDIDKTLEELVKKYIDESSDELDLQGDFGFFDPDYFSYPSEEDLEYPDVPPPIPEIEKI